MPYIVVAYTYEQEKIPASEALPFCKAFLLFWLYCLAITYVPYLKKEVSHVWIKRLTKQQAQQHAEQN